jgi:Ras-related protein Rab-5C
MLLDPHVHLREAKVILLGPASAGKTSLLTRLTVGGFDAGTQTTIAGAKTTQLMQVGDTQIKLHFWDTAGTERFRALVPLYYQNIDGAVLVYDITSLASFSEMQRWYEELSSSVARNIAIVLAGSKSDLAALRQVEANAGHDFAKRKGLCSFRETSALTGQGVLELFDEVARAVIEVVRQKSMEEVPPPSRAAREAGGSCC